MQLFVKRFFVVLVLVLMSVVSARAEDVKETKVYARIKKALDAVPAIDTHSHLCGPSMGPHLLKNSFRSEKPTDCVLRWVWSVSYLTWGHPLAAWPADGKFETWWTAAQADFDNYRARSAYQALLPIFRDLYDVDFDTLTVKQAKKLNAKMEKNFANPEWAHEVLVKRANTEILVIDSYVMPTCVRDHFPFTASACNVRRYINGFHPTEFERLPNENPYTFAEQNKMSMKSLDDYVAVLDRILVEAKKNGAICLKSQIAYDRTLRTDRVSKQRAEVAFGKPRKELTPAQVKDFQDYIFWRLAELSAKHELPFQIHTGHAKIPGSNPMNLVNLIEANPKTKFVLFHGGFPWVGETGMVALKYPNVYVDSVWLPSLSYSMGKRAFKEWIEMFSSNRIMWGSDMFTVEGSYGATILARQCLTEALAEKVLAEELREDQAIRIGRQILRENALELFPALRERMKRK